MKKLRPALSLALPLWIPAREGKGLSAAGFGRTGARQWAVGTGFALTLAALYRYAKRRKEAAPWQRSRP